MICSVNVRRLFMLLRPASSFLFRRWLPIESSSAIAEPGESRSDYLITRLSYPLFDGGWYLTQYPDIAASEIDPLDHYLSSGAAEGRDPNPLFDSDWYLAQNPDVAVAGMNPLEHYLSSGAAEGRDPNPLFDSDWYLAQNPDVAAAGMNPLEHYLCLLAAEGESVSTFFQCDCSGFASGYSNPELSRWQDEKRAKDDLKAFLSSSSRIKFISSVNPDISVIIVLWNAAHFTLRCLLALSAQTGPSLEVLLVDNASSDDTKSLIDRVEGATKFHNATNAGFLLACNQAALNSRGQALLLLNSDAFVRPGALGSAFLTLNSNADIGAVGGRLVSASGALQEAGGIIWKDGSTYGYGRGFNPESGFVMYKRDVDFCSGAFLMTKRNVWQTLSGFDESYAPAYYEDTDYCMRLRNAGWRVVFDPRICVDHHEWGSQSQSGEAVFTTAENRKRFEYRHRDALKMNHLPYTEKNLLFGRERSSMRHRRLLYIDNEVPLSTVDSGFLRTGGLLREAVAAGWDVGFYPLRKPVVNWEEIRSELPYEIEILSGCGVMHLARFLKSRAGYYDVIIVRREDNMHLFQTARKKQEYLMDGTQIIFDDEADVNIRKALGLKIVQNTLSVNEPI